jgi:hypothetical protein
MTDASLIAGMFSDDKLIWILVLTRENIRFFRPCFLLKASSVSKRIPVNIQLDLVRLDTDWTPTRFRLSFMEELTTEVTE